MQAAFKGPSPSGGMGERGHHSHPLEVQETGEEAGGCPVEGERRRGHFGPCRAKRLRAAEEVRWR